MKIQLSNDGNGFRRFETIKFQYAQDPVTIVKINKTPTETTFTLKKIKWSKYKIINRLIKLFYRVRYM